MEVLIGYGSLSDFESKLMEMDKIQIELRAAVSEIQAAREQMEKERKAMEEDLEENEEYKKVQEYSKYSLAIRQDQQEYLLQQLTAAKTPLEKEIARIEAELIELKRAMGRIQSYLSMWLIDGTPTWSQIFSAVERASSATNAKKALILGILQIESSFGTGLGEPGRYKTACDWGWGEGTSWECNNLEELLKICQRYGYDPSKVPMSTRCAIGPSQFVPCTWRAYGGTSNPWNLNDAILAMARKLGPASSRKEEIRDVDNYNPCRTSSKCVHGYFEGVYVTNLPYVKKVIPSADAWQEVISICGLDLNCPQMRERLEEKFGSIPIE